LTLASIDLKGATDPQAGNKKKATQKNKIAFFISQSFAKHAYKECQKICN